jgi:tripartite-type tricarboxylate transporter receptor subunit TctC
MHPARYVCSRRVVACAAIVAAFFSTAQAQDYPTRPIEMVVTWGPGGGADQTGRMIGKLLEPELKVSIPVENVAGSSGVTGLNKLLGGNPEGYQLGLITADTLSLLAAPRAQRWSLNDIVMVAVLIKQPSGFFVQEGGAFKSWADVEAKAKTTELKVGVTGLGTPDELAIEQLKKHRGLKLVAVPFAKPSERYASVLGGHADLVYEQAGDVRSFIENKQLRPVLFLANEKVEPFTDVTITKDLGMNLVLDQYRALMAKAGTPPERLKLLREQTAKVGASPEFKKFLTEAWADPNSVIAGEPGMAYVADQIKILKSIWQ